MPTIQFQTDDRTEAASSALFTRLGMTMSDAINMFLRQSIVRGGIPFALAADDVWDAAVADAGRRCAEINGGARIDTAAAEPFLRALRTLEGVSRPRVTFYADAVKVTLAFGGGDFVIDYHYDEPESALVLSRKADKLFVKDCALDGIARTLGEF